MDKDEQAVEVEDEIFEEIIDDDDVPEQGFVKGSVDTEDLATGFDATIPTREIDVDEDTQGDEAVGAGGEELMTQFEVANEVNGVVHGDEIELDLDDALTTGRTVTEAPESDEALD